MADQVDQATAEIQTFDSQALDIFAENLLIEKGAYRLDPETIGGMKKEITERLELLVNKVSLEALSEEDLVGFNKLLDEGADPDKMQAFIAEKVPDIKQRLMDALYRFRLVYLGIK